MGVPIYCCSRNKKVDDFKEEPSIIIADQIENRINLGITNKETNFSGTLRNLDTLKKKKDSIADSKYKRPSQKISIKDSPKNTILSNLSKKCTYDQKVIKKHIHPKSILKYSESLFIPEINKRISHRINIDSIIENNNEEYIEKDNKEKNNFFINELESNNLNSNIIEKRRKSIINIMNLGNVNNLKIKDKESDDDKINNSLNEEDNIKKDINLITKGNLDNNKNKIDKMNDDNDFQQVKENQEFESVLNPIMDEENEEDEDEENNKNKPHDTIEILYFNELKHTKSIPRPKINTLPIEVIH